MTVNDLIFLGLKNQVSALAKSDGLILWATKLPGSMGHSFVTLNCDGKHVYACANGRLHCLDALSGRILWSNGLKGYGYNIASIGIAGFPPAPDPAAFARKQADQQSSSDSSLPVS